MLRQCIVAAHLNNSRDTISLGFGTMSLLYANAASVVLQLREWWVGRNSKRAPDTTTEGSWLHLPRDRVSNTHLVTTFLLTLHFSCVMTFFLSIRTFSAAAIKCNLTCCQVYLTLYPINNMLPEYNIMYAQRRYNRIT